ncbi:MAG TPA: ABC transporter substrate-binding protein [Roseiflexaceae bacterium]|nr:ABC transporter substrate-binding protein [Roseiflexaceae bacterium]
MGKRGTKDRRTISRREFLRLSATLTAGAGLAACGGEPPAPVVAPTAAPAAPAAAPTAAPAAAPTAAPAAAAEAPTAAPAAAAGTGKYAEAPMLADLVGQGKLPPVDQRLPKNPVVLDGVDGVGKYGGTMRRGFNGVSDRWGPTKTQNEALTWYTPDLKLRANMVESWEVSDDAKQWTFKLREGMKWSDGSDFTSDDWKYWFDNVLNNDDLKKNPDIITQSDWATGNPRVFMKAEFPDKLTAIYTFEHPRPLFGYTVARGQPFAPAKFMQQFHPNFTDKAKLDADAKAAGFDAWDKYYADKNFWYMTPDRPWIGPWVSKNKLSEQLFLMERNPYFWQVDSAGNQLPYIDKVNHLLFEAPEAFNTRIIAGEVDFQARHVSIGNFTLFKENESAGDYSVVLGVNANHIAFQPNHTAKNPKIRELFQNRDVRIALSLAINRQEINDLVYNGTATPRQYSPIKLSPQYYEKLTTAHIEYNKDKANELLDAAGYDKKGADGFRLWKDGSGPVSFIVEGTAQPGSPDEDAVQTMVKYFADVGIKATYKVDERALYTERYQANEVESAFWGGDRTVLPLVAPIIWLGTQPDRPWAVAWGLKKNNPEDANGEDPPEGHFITKIWELWDQTSAEPDEAKRNALFNQILDIWAEEVPMIGILGELPAPVIVKNGFKGYKEGFPVDDTTEDEHLLNTQTYYWDDPSKHA